MFHIMIVVVFILLYIFFKTYPIEHLKLENYLYICYVSIILPQKFDIRAKIFEKTNNKGRNRKRRCQHFSSQRCLYRSVPSLHSRIQLINIYQWYGGGFYSPGTVIYCINPQALGVNTVNKNKVFTFQWGKINKHNKTKQKPIVR